MRVKPHIVDGHVWRSRQRPCPAGGPAIRPDRSFGRAVFFLATLGLGLPVWATTWYVSTTGSDTNAGNSPNAPFAHVQTAMNHAVTYGDTVNIQAGIYREQVSTGLGLYGTGSLTNMLTVQAWDTNGDGIIETNEMPTITAAQAITNWTAVTNTSLWAALTGLDEADFESNTIFWTYWSTNDTVANPLGLVLESDTNALQQTSWPSNALSQCTSPAYQPTEMSAGSFQYDYTNHILYVWRSDGNTPGPAYPIQAALLDSTQTGSSCGNNGPFYFGVDYLSLKGIKFRYCNADYASECVSSYGIVTVPAHSKMDGCDVQWACVTGVSDGAVLTNCVVANCGGCAIAMFGGGPANAPSNVLVTACTLRNNGWRFPQEANPPAGCPGFSEGMLHVIGCWAGLVISNNTFMGNYQDAIHCDGAVGLPGSPIVIINNFLNDTNVGPQCDCVATLGRGIELEVSSGINIIGNVIIGASSALDISGSSSNSILNNTILIAPSLQPYWPASGSVLALTVAPSYSAGPGGWTNAAAHNTFISNVIASYYDSPMICVGQSSNTPTATPYGPLEFSNVYAYNVTWNYPESRALSGPPIQFHLFFPPSYITTYATYTNAQAFFQAAAGTDGPLQNIGNVVAAPVATPVVLGLSQSPSAKLNAAPSLRIGR